MDSPPDQTPTSFLVFSGMAYYPSYAWHDFCGARSTIQEAQALVARCRAYGYFDWYQIVSTVTLTIVEQGYFTAYGPNGDRSEVDREDWERFLAHGETE